MKYRLLVNLGIHKAGEVLEGINDFEYKVPIGNPVLGNPVHGFVDTRRILPHEILLMLHAGMLERVCNHGTEAYCGCEFVKQKVLCTCGTILPCNIQKHVKQDKRPEMGERYFWFDSVAYIDDAYWCGDSIDCTREYCGNCFKTRAAAESARDKVKELLTSLPRE